MRGLNPALANQRLYTIVDLAEADPELACSIPLAHLGVGPEQPHHFVMHLFGQDPALPQSGIQQKTPPVRRQTGLIPKSRTERSIVERIERRLAKASCRERV